MPIEAFLQLICSDMGICSLVPAQFLENENDIDGVTEATDDIPYEWPFVELNLCNDAACDGFWS